MRICDCSSDVCSSDPVSLLVRGGGADAAVRIARLDAQLRFLCRIERIETLDGEPPADAPAVVGELQLFVPLEGLVDLAAERTRLDKEQRTEERRVGKEGVSTGRSRWSPDH